MRRLIDLTGAEWNWSTAYKTIIDAALAGKAHPNFLRGGLKEGYVKMSAYGSMVSDAAKKIWGTEYGEPMTAAEDRSRWIALVVLCEGMLMIDMYEQWTSREQPEQSALGSLTAPVAAPLPAAAAVAGALMAYRDRLGVRSFNLALWRPPLADHAASAGWEVFPTIAWLVDRGDPFIRPSDIGAMELYGTPIVGSDPYEVIRAVRQA